MRLTQDRRVRGALLRLLPRYTPLVVVLTACVMLRQAVTPSDIARWAASGQLPFFDMPHRCSALLRDVSPEEALPKGILSPGQVPVVQTLVRASVDLAASLGVELPNVPAEALLLRATVELRLPQAVFYVARELFALYLADTPHMALSFATPSSSPYVYIAALVALAAKLAYGIGSAADLGARLPGLPPPPCSWIEWADACLRSPGCRPLHLPMTESEASELTGARLLEYLDFCQHTVFSGMAAPEAMRDMQAMLQRRLDEALQSAGTAAPAARLQPRDGGDTGSKWAHGMSEMHGHPNAPVGRRQGLAEAAGAALGGADTTPSGAAATRRPAHRRRAAALCEYVRSKHASIGAFNPTELVAVVAAIAAHAGVRPVRVLHALCALEEQAHRTDVAYRRLRASIAPALQESLCIAVPPAGKSTMLRRTVKQQEAQVRRQADGPQYVM